MTLLLCGDKPLLIDPELAVHLGDRATSLLQQIHYWLNRSKHVNIIEGRRWIYNTYENWQKEFKHLSDRTIKRLVKYLKDLKILLVERFNARSHWDQTNWYSIDYEALERFILSRVPKCLSGECNSGTTENDNLAQSFTDISSKEIHTNTTTTEPTHHPVVDSIDVLEEEDNQEGQQQVLQIPEKPPEPLKDEESLDCQQQISVMPEKAPEPKPLDDINPKRDMSSPAPVTKRNKPSVERKPVPKNQPDQESFNTVIQELRALPCTPSFIVNETVRSVVKSNWANVAEAIKYIKNAMKTWKVQPGFNWQAMFVKACKHSYKVEETQRSYEQEEINPPTPEQMALLEQAKQEKRILDIYFSDLYNCTRVIKFNGAQINWWDFLNLQT